MPAEKKLAATSPWLKNPERRTEITRRQVLESSFFEGARGLDSKVHRADSSKMAASKALAKKSAKGR